MFLRPRGEHHGGNTYAPKINFLINEIITKFIKIKINIVEE